MTSKQLRSIPFPNLEMKLWEQEHIQEKENRNEFAPFTFSSNTYFVKLSFRSDFTTI